MPKALVSSQPSGRLSHIIASHRITGPSLRKCFELSCFWNRTLFSEKHTKGRYALQIFPIYTQNRAKTHSCMYDASKILDGTLTCKIVDGTVAKLSGYQTTDRMLHRFDIHILAPNFNFNGRPTLIDVAPIQTMDASKLI